MNIIVLGTSKIYTVTSSHLKTVLLRSYLQLVDQFDVIISVIINSEKFIMFFDYHVPQFIQAVIIQYLDQLVTIKNCFYLQEFLAKQFVLRTSIQQFYQLYYFDSVLSLFKVDHMSFIFGGELNIQNINIEQLSSAVPIDSAIVFTSFFLQNEFFVVEQLINQIKIYFPKLHVLFLDSYLNPAIKSTNFITSLFTKEYKMINAAIDVTKYVDNDVFQKYLFRNQSSKNQLFNLKILQKSIFDLQQMNSISLQLHSYDFFQYHDLIINSAIQQNSLQYMQYCCSYSGQICWLIRMNHGFSINQYYSGKYFIPIYLKRVIEGYECYVVPQFSLKQVDLMIGDIIQLVRSLFNYVNQLYLRGLSFCNLTLESLVISNNQLYFNQFQLQSGAHIMTIKSLQIIVNQIVVQSHLIFEQNRIYEYQNINLYMLKNLIQLLNNKQQLTIQQLLFHALIFQSSQQIIQKMVLIRDQVQDQHIFEKQSLLTDQIDVFCIHFQQDHSLFKNFWKVLNYFRNKVVHDSFGKFLSTEELLQYFCTIVRGFVQICWDGWLAYLDLL